MVVRRYVGDKIVCLSTDEKPLDIADGANLFELDTGKQWLLIDNVWTSISGDIQVVNYQTGEVATGSTLIPFDDTIPQNTEGDQYMFRAITPKNVNNKLKIEVVFFGAYSTATWSIVALFQDDVANALAVMPGFDAGTKGYPISFTHYMTAGTTSEIIFKVRAGGNEVGTMTFNGHTGNRKFGGKIASSITITERAA